MEGSLKKAKGVKSIKVNFGTKNATVEFDEAVISAQEVARAFSDTPHMMGRDMQYGGSLVLSVAGLKDDATGKKAKDALSKVEGVSKVTPFPKQESASVEFGGKGKVTSKQLIEALDKVGLKGSQYGTSDTKKTNAARTPGEHEGMAMNDDARAGTRTANGNMAGMRMNGTRGHAMSCGCSMCMQMMGMDDMGDMEDRDADVDAAPPRTVASTVAVQRGYYGGMRSGGCGCCR
ncbi:MAG: cation transporter [Planctomycetes bacterium]|nr:cation transporter [Planctomycetota bacterium]